MDNAYTIFDAEKVQLATRRRVRKLLLPLAGAGLLSLLVVAAWQAGLITGSMSTFLVLILFGVISVWTLRRRAQLRSIMWCIKISDDEIVGYDYARQKLTWPWESVLRIELTDAKVILSNARAERMMIPSNFQGFSELSHLLICQAERWDIKLHIDGRDFDELDVYELFPFLLDDTPGPSAPQSSAPH